MASWYQVRPLFLSIVLFWVCVWAAVAHAATIQVTCTAPTTNVDGTPITSTLAYKAYWGTSAASLTSAVPLAGPGCKGPVSVPDAPVGGTVTYHVAVTAIANGMESARSATASKSFSTPNPPSPPTGVLLTADQVGYQQNLGSRNKISLSRVATVPLGKPCIATMSLTDPYRKVYIIADRMWATMDPNPNKPGTLFTRPNQVWAKCEAS